MAHMDRISNSLKHLGNNLWSANSSHEISYPEDGHQHCFELEDHSFWFRHRSDCIVAAMGRFSPHGTVLDIGGGNGYVTSCLNRNNIESILMEPGQQGVLNARKRGLKPIIYSSFEDARISDRSLDAAGLFDVLEHIEDDLAFLKSLRRAIRPDGRLYLTVPAHKALWSKEDDKARHFRRYSMNQLRRSLEQAGYTLEYSTYFFAFLPIPILLLRTLPSLLGLRNNTPENQNPSKEHTMPGPAQKIISAMLAREISSISNGKSIAFGSSILAVASA